jgi:integrase
MKLRGQGRIFLRGSVLWIAYYLRGKEYRESAHTTDENTAKRFLKHRLKEVGADTLGLKTFVAPAQHRLTIQNLVDALESDYKLRGKASLQNLSNLKRARRDFGPVLATSLTAEAVDQYIEKRLAAGDRPATINRATQVLSQAYKLAIERRHLSTAPHIRKLSEKGNERQGFFSDSEFRLVMSNLPEHLKDFALFGYLCGWRKGEIASLRWADVDGDTIRLRGENSKNGEARLLAFDGGELAELMERRAKARVIPNLNGPLVAEYVFHHDGEPIKDFRKSWASACKLAGVSGKLFHDLRRTAVRDLIRCGVHEATARKISGHKTPSMLQRYNIQSESDIRQALELRSAHIAAQPDDQRAAPMSVPTTVQ